MAYNLSFNYDGQITEINDGIGATNFAYDAGGRRVSRSAGGATTEFAFAGSAVLLEKQSGSVTASYLYGNGLVKKDSETFLYDGLGSSRQSTDASGSITSERTFEAFGQMVSSSGSSSSPYRFAATSGYRSDGDAGLSHVGARCYNAQVGRFITRDTMLDQKPPGLGMLALPAAGVAVRRCRRRA